MPNNNHAETGTLSERSGKLYLTMDAGGNCEVRVWPVAGRYVGQRVHIVGKLGFGNVLAAQSIRLIQVATSIEPGDVVRHAAGGPDMTVVGIERLGSQDPLLSCEWLDRRSVELRGSFLLRSLVKVS